MQFSKAVKLSKKKYRFIRDEWLKDKEMRDCFCRIEEIDGIETVHFVTGERFAAMYDDVTANDWIVLVE